MLPPETREGHCRLGWSLSPGSLQGPVGYDKFSYAYRDIAGSKVHGEDSGREGGAGTPCLQTRYRCDCFGVLCVCRAHTNSVKVCSQMLKVASESKPE